MAARALSLFSFLLLLLLLSPAVFADDHSEHKNSSSPFDFLRHLQGCHKGDNITGINDLKKYLEHFGYLSYNYSHASDDDFDDALEYALKTYQINYHIEATGVLDAATVSKMVMPRCGVADIINGTSRMTAAGERHHLALGSGRFHIISHYSFFSGNPRWPSSKYRLTYALRPGTRTDAVQPVVNAFRTWDANTHFTFTQTQDYQNADLKVSFDSRDHRDGYPFDGPGGTLAHAFAPTDGRFHYDADERWSVGVAQGAFHLETVALHEIGHLLGLDHSSVEAAIMYPTISSGVSRGLHQDDIQGIRALYNT